MFTESVWLLQIGAKTDEVGNNFSLKFRLSMEISLWPPKLSSFNFSFHGRIQIFNIRLNYSQLGKQRIPFKEIEKSKMKQVWAIKVIEIWIKDQKAVLQIHKATWKTYVVKLFMILFTMKHRQCWMELKKGGKKATFLVAWFHEFTQFMKLFWYMNRFSKL